jgi:adenine-specific DNA methylase
MLQLMDQLPHYFDNLISFSSNDEATSDIKRIAADLIFFVVDIPLNKRSCANVRRILNAETLFSPTLRLSSVRLSDREESRSESSSFKPLASEVRGWVPARDFFEISISFEIVNRVSNPSLPLSISVFVVNEHLGECCSKAICQELWQRDYVRCLNDGRDNSVLHPPEQQKAGTIGSSLIG